MAKRLAWGILGLCWGSPLFAQQPDVDVVTCDSTTDGWLVLDTSGGSAQANLSVTRTPEAVREGAGALELSYERKPNVFAILLAPALLTNLRTIEFDVWSQAATTLALAVEDREGAKFHWAVEVQAAKWKRIRIGPGEFQLSDDSPVKKSRVEPKKLRYGFGLLDLAPAGGVEGANVLRVDNLRVTREPLSPVRLPAVVDGKTIEIASDGWWQGNVVIKNGGVLKITASRFVYSGDVTVENGKWETAGAALTLRGRFSHDLKILVGSQSSVRFRDSVLLCNTIHGMGVLEKGRLEIERTLVATGGFTVDLRSGSSVLLDRAQRVGEFIVSKGSRFTALDSEGALIWFTPAPEVEVRLKLPGGASVEHWVFPDGLGAQGSVQRSKSIAWGLVSTPASRIVVEEGELAGVGVVLGGKSEQKISGVRNGESVDLKLPDRTLRFEKAVVRAWNFYPAEQSSLELTAGTFGELLAFGEARALVEDSTCDGSGGYVRAEGRSTLTLRNCILTCAVVASEEATLVLENCAVQGAVTASGRSTVRLVNTKVTGTVERLDKAVVEKK